MTDRLTGRVALISGAASGMGAAHARAFVAEGASAVLGNIADESGARLADELGELAGHESSYRTGSEFVVDGGMTAG